MKQPNPAGVDSSTSSRLTGFCRNRADENACQSSQSPREERSGWGRCSLPALPVATADTGKLIAAAMTALGIIFKPGYRYKKAGVTFLDLAPSGRVQSGLFDQPDDARSVGRMRAIDPLNARFGRGTIGFGTAGERQAWSLRREFASPRFTTDWHELLRV
jgi:hypothetical protein